MARRAAPLGADVDHWRELGLEPGADADTLKRAFRAQARRWHPDLNANDPVAEERFKRINEAYAVLSDPRRRQAWETGHQDPDSGDADPFAVGFPEFDEYLDELFGRRQSRSRPGSSWPEPEPEPEPEPAGRVTPPQPAPPPPVQASEDLETIVDLTPDQALHGERIELTLPDGTTVEVTTPPMAGDGWRLRLAGVTPTGGDHFLHLRVRTAEGLRIDGLRVLFQLDLHPADAALGCAAVVPTLAGAVRLQVPAGSSSGRLLRLRGRGLESGHQRGDQFVELRLVIPDPLSEAEEALFRRLQQLAREADQQR
ncbi:MAG: DnaJ domain-containing protein [Cyanobacteriota bacterium]